MPRNLCFIGLLLWLSGLQAQGWKYEVNAITGLSQFRSAEQMREYYDVLNQEAPEEVVRQGFRFRGGVTYGLQGMASYPLSPRFDICTGLELVRTNHHIHRSRKVRTGSDSSFRKAVTRARVAVTSMQIPIQLRYQFPWRDSLWTPFAGLGVSIEKRLQKQLFLTENVFESAREGGLALTSIAEHGPYQLDGLSDDGLNLRIETGTELRYFEKIPITASLELRHSLYGSRLSTSKIDKSTKPQLKLGEIFTSTHQQHIEEVHDISLDDWKRTAVVLKLGARF